MSPVGSSLMVVVGFAVLVGGIYLLSKRSTKRKRASHHASRKKEVVTDAPITFAQLSQWVSADGHRFFRGANSREIFGVSSEVKIDGVVQTMPLAYVPADARSAWVLGPDHVVAISYDGTQLVLFEKLSQGRYEMRFARARESLDVVYSELREMLDSRWAQVSARSRFG